MSGYYTVWQDGDSNTIDITGPIINGPWRIRPEGDMLLLEYCSGGKYVDFAIGWFDDSQAGNWQFRITSSGSGNDNVLSIGRGPAGINLVDWTSTDNHVDEWRFNVACNSSFSPEAILNDSSVDTGFFAYQPGSFTTSLADLLTCFDYTTKPVSDYLESLCCLKGHYKVIRQYLEAQQNVAVSCGNRTLTRWTQTVAIAEICCALELLENLEAQLNIDADGGVSQAGQGTQDAVLDFFNYLVAAKALVVLNSDLQRITSLNRDESRGMPGCFSTYGVLRYSDNCCRRRPFYLRPCFVATTNNAPV